MQLPGRRGWWAIAAAAAAAGGSNPGSNSKTDDESADDHTADLLTLRLVPLLIRDLQPRHFAARQHIAALAHFLSWLDPVRIRARAGGQRDRDSAS